MLSSSLGTALITGASSGIGALYADRFAARGYDLILVARSQSRLGTLARQLTEQHAGRSIRVFPADLNDRSQLRKVEALIRESETLSVLINNAGFGSTAPLLQSDLDRMDEMISLNVTALTHLSYAAASGFVARQSGAIINIASIAAIAPELLSGVYGGTKAYVLALTLSLNHELGKQGVQVQAVLPSAVATDFWEIAGKPVNSLPAHIVMSASNLVDAALAGFDMGELITLPSLPNAADWQAYEAARQELLPNLSRAIPADRYTLRAPT